MRIAQDLDGDIMAAFPIMDLIHGSESTPTKIAGNLKPLRKIDIDCQREGFERLRVRRRIGNPKVQVGGQSRVLGCNAFKKMGPLVCTLGRYRGKQFLNPLLERRTHSGASG